MKRRSCVRLRLRCRGEINEKRQELLARESQLKELESRMVRDQTPSQPTVDEEDEAGPGA